MALDKIIARAGQAGIRLIVTFGDNWMYADSKHNVSCSPLHAQQLGSSCVPLYERGSGSGQKRYVVCCTSDSKRRAWVACSHVAFLNAVKKATGPALESLADLQCSTLTGQATPTTPTPFSLTARPSCFTRTTSPKSRIVR